MPEAFEIRATCTLNNGWLVRVWIGVDKAPSENDINLAQTLLMERLFDISATGFHERGILAEELIKRHRYDAVEVTAVNGSGAVLYRKWP